MWLTRFEHISQDELCDRLRRVTLRGDSSVRPYEGCDITLLCEQSPTSPQPAQAYLLWKNIDFIHDLRALFLREGVEIFSLDGAIRFWLARKGVEQGPFVLTPPIVEEAFDKYGYSIRIVNDGMHRLYCARMLGLKTSMVFVSGGALNKYPYYAYPLENGWDGVKLFDDSVPEGFVKRRYRDPENYKALFRDFSPAFGGLYHARS